MKIFKYRWKSGEREITGIKKAAGRAELEEHVTSVGGSLLEIFSEQEIEIPPAEPITAAAPAVSEIPESQGPSKKRKENFLSPGAAKARKDLITRIFSWLVVLTGLFSLYLCLMSVYLIAEAAAGRPVEGAAELSHAVIWLFGIFAALLLSLGTGMLLRPGLAVWVFFLACAASFAGSIWDIIAGSPFRGMVLGSVSALLMVHILRPRA